MFVAGYTFYVMNNAFLSHWGYAELGSSPEWRNLERVSNEFLLPAFLREVSVHYQNDPFGMVEKFFADKVSIKKVLSTVVGKSPEVFQNWCFTVTKGQVAIWHMFCATKIILLINLYHLDYFFYLLSGNWRQIKLPEFAHKQYVPLNTYC